MDRDDVTVLVTSVVAKKLPGLIQGAPSAG